MQKGLYTVSYFAQMIESLTDVANSIDWEAAQEMDDSPLPGQFKEWLASGCEILKAMAAEEVDELLADLSKTVGAGFKPALPLAKAGARHSAADLEHIQAVHDHAVSLGADCAAEKVVGAVGAGLKPALTPAPTEDLAKTLAAKDEELAKAVSALAEKSAAYLELETKHSETEVELEKLKAEPAPAKGALKAVPKEADALNKTTEEEKPLTPLEEVVAARQKPFLIR